MTRVGILVLIATIIMVLIHLSWDYTGMDSIHDPTTSLLTLVLKAFIDAYRYVIIYIPFTRYVG